MQMVDFAFRAQRDKFKRRFCFQQWKIIWMKKLNKTRNLNNNTAGSSL
jgi:hypothetical protein